MPPYPAYAVTFEIPIDLPIVMTVTMANNVLVPSNALALIQQAVQNAFAGVDGGIRQKIGSTVFASRFYGGVAAQWDGAQIVSITIGSANAPAAQFAASIAGTVLTVTGAVTGTIAVGQTIKDVSGLVLPGTIIETCGGGSGGDGTYNLNLSQTVGSEPMVSIAPTLNEVGVNLDQVGTISAADITLVLA